MSLSLQGQEKIAEVKSLYELISRGWKSPPQKHNFNSILPGTHNLVIQINAGNLIKRHGFCRVGFKVDVNEQGKVFIDRWVTYFAFCKGFEIFDIEIEDSPDNPLYKRATIEWKYKAYKGMRYMPYRDARANVGVPIVKECEGLSVVDITSSGEYKLIESGGCFFAPSSNCGIDECE